MKNKFLLLLLLGVMSLLTAFSQTNNRENAAFIETLIEEISTSSEQEIDFSELYDDLAVFIENPINLNAATRDDLEKFQFLNELQISNLLNYTAKFGSMLSIYELQLIEGFDEQTIRFLLPFAEVNPITNEQYWKFKDAFSKGKQQIILRSQTVLEKQVGFMGHFDSLRPNAHYLGDPFRQYLKYSFAFKSYLSFGITAEKDAGEEFFKGSNRAGFDYYSAYFMIQNRGRLQKLIVGDYNLQFGQGLTFWSGFGSGKSSFVLNSQKYAQGIKKYSSTDENAFMRGTAATIKLGDFKLTGFFSHKSVDANLGEPDSLGTDVLDFSSFQLSGFHSTPTEIANENKLMETVWGGNTTFKKNDLKLGLQFIRYQYDKALNKEIKPYNRFDFSGKSNINVGVDYQYVWRNFHFFGEGAMSQNSAKAILSGVTVELHQQVSISVLYRNFDKDYQALYAAAFSENSKPANEKGFYIGAQILPYKKWKLLGYFDSYQFPWLKYRVDAPSAGYDAMAQAEFTPSRKMEITLKYRYQHKQQNSSVASEVIHTITDLSKESIRIQANYQLSYSISMSSRLEWVNYQKESVSETGYLMYQNIDYKPFKLPITIQVRYAVFDSPSFYSAIWAYENDVLYGYSIPAFYSKGSRFYINLKYTIRKNIDLWLRYTQTRYDDKTSIGAGLTQINGNTRSDVKLQLRLVF